MEAKHVMGDKYSRQITKDLQREMDGDEKLALQILKRLQKKMKDKATRHMQQANPNTLKKARRNTLVESLLKAQVWEIACMMLLDEIECLERKDDTNG